MGEVQCTFLVSPEVGSPASVQVNGQNVRTSPVVNIQTNPQFPGWYWVDTQSGSRYSGQTQQIPVTSGISTQTVYGRSAATITGSRPVTASAALSHADLVGYAGSAALLFGLFAPMVTVPLVGNINFLMGGIGPGMLLLATGPLGMLFVLMRKRKLVFVTGIASLILTIGGFVFLAMTKWHGLADAVKSHDKGEAFGGVVGTVGIGIGWGWALLIIGSFLLVASAWNRE